MEEPQPSMLWFSKKKKEKKKDQKKGEKKKGVSVIRMWLLGRIASPVVRGVSLSFHQQRMRIFCVASENVPIICGTHSFRRGERSRVLRLFFASHFLSFFKNKADFVFYFVNRQCPDILCSDE